MDAQNTTEMEDPQLAKRVNKNLVLNAYNSNSDNLQIQLLIIMSH